MAYQPLAPHLGLSNTKCHSSMQLHSQTFAINISQEAQFVHTLFPERKQEVPQDKCHLNRISMTVYFSFNVYQSSHDTLYCAFHSDF